MNVVRRHNAVANDLRLRVEPVDMQSERLGSDGGSVVGPESVGLGMAKATNRSALIGTFSNRREARRMFGQPLAPLDPSGLPWAERSALVQKFKPWSPAGRTIA